MTADTFLMVVGLTMLLGVCVGMAIVSYFSARNGK